MLLLNNYAVSTRTSLEYPYAHKDGDTIFLPINVKDALVSTWDEEGIEHKEPGYAFDEYRINKGSDLPKEAVDAVIDAFIQDEEALKTLGIGG